MNTIFFKETQRFNVWWIWLILLVCAFFSFQPLLKAIQSNEGISSDQIIGLIVLGLVILLFMLFRLDTKIQEEGIYVQFLPFHLKKKFHAWDSISHVEVVEYSPLKDFGGWGLRWGRKGKCYTVKGNSGIYIHFADGKKLLIGTQKPEEVKRILETKNR